MTVKKILSPIYKIKNGDTLKSIASKYKINPTEILLFNNITPRQIHEGFILFLDIN